MPVTESTDLALIGRDTALTEALREAAGIAPIDAVADAEKQLASLVVETEEDAKTATALAGRFSGWSSRITEYWKIGGAFHWKRYKMFQRVTQEGIRNGDIEIPGTERLDRSKALAESKNKAYLRQKQIDTAKRQEAIERAVAADTRTLDKKIGELADAGEMAKARELMREREITAQAPVIMAPPPDIGAASVAETVKWSIAPTTGLMDLVRAVASGQVPLYREVTIKGMKEIRPLFLVNEVVLNQATRAMGKNLNWPGVVLEDDINLRTRKS